MEFLARELDRDGGISEMPLAREQLEAFVMTQVRLAVPNSYTDLLAGYIGVPGPPGCSRCSPAWTPTRTNR